ncbi:MAG TPA: hypothetical protein VGB62_02720 [Allosphingosinicella sp.]|jgi:hypothetical protein
MSAGRSSRATAIVLVIWVLCFLIGTFTHTRTLLGYGWLPYDWVPMPVNIFWTLLTFADPLAALLLLVRRNAGIVLGLAIMIADVAINTWVAYGYQGLSGALQAQTLFLGFTLGSFRLIWNAHPQELSPVSSLR